MRIEEAIQQSAFKTSQQKAIINLLFTANEVKNRNTAIIKPFGLAPQHYNVLRILRGAHPKPKSAGEIKAVMLDKSPDLTRIIDKLEKGSLVSRKTCKDNRRKVDITISKKGLELLKEIDPLIDEFQAAFHVLSEEEAETLSSLLDKLRGEG
jgi:MarR family 2-MHQ and catechol resistance regulon transcriptional repressor